MTLLFSLIWQRLRHNPVGSHAYFQLELPGAKEPQDSLQALPFGKCKETHDNILKQKVLVLC